ncbi:HPr family phosphocarrier protein [Photobacterium damselae]|nr:HPr family phosphocarrier protein [Photobacterium damselae]UKA29510.1 HPr family phosphocarrier protein [Photobacterium damselae subsp. damselae]
MTTSRQVYIKNRLGLHARAAIKIVETAQSYQATITLCNGEKCATADGVMGLLMLESAQGQQITVSAQGEQSEQVLTAICHLIEAGFDEES